MVRFLDARMPEIHSQDISLNEYAIISDDMCDIFSSQVLRLIIDTYANVKINLNPNVKQK